MPNSFSWVHEWRRALMVKSQSMNERQQAHLNYYLERLAYWRTKASKGDGWSSRMLAARDADAAHPLRTEEEATEVFAYLHGLKQEPVAGHAVRVNPA